MDAMYMVFYILSFVCFIIAALSSRGFAGGRVNLVALGLAFWVLVFVIESIRLVAA